MSILKINKHIKPIIGTNALILIVIALVSIFTPLAMAETGTLSVDQQTNNLYSVGASFSSGSYDWTSLAFDYSDYNSITELTYSSTCSYPIMADSTSFTISSGGSGHGTAYYGAGYAHWTFIDTVITSTPIVLSYNRNIFTGTTSCGTGSDNYEDVSTLSVTEPIYIVSNFVGHNNRRATGSYSVTTSKTFSNSYNVTYPSSGLFTVHINKSGTAINSKITISNYTYGAPFYFSETTYNTNGFNYTGTYLSGISLKMNDSSDNYDIAYVNSTGCPSCPTTPTPAPTPVIDPSTGTGIVWDASTHTIGDNAVVSWVYDQDVLDSIGAFFGFSYFVSIGQTTSLETGDTIIDIGSSGNYTKLLDKTGNWYAKIGKRGIFSSSIVETATTSVIAATPAFISINASNPYHTQVPVSYSFGFGSLDLRHAIVTYYHDLTTNTYQFEHSFFNVSSTGVGTTNVYFERVGDYIIKLKNVQNSAVYAQATTKTTFSAPSINITIPTTTLYISKQNYFYGDTIFGNYTIDTTNWTAGQLYLSVYNNDKAITTGVMFGSGAGWTDISGKQQGTLLVSLLDVIPSESFQGISFVSGNNSLRIMLRDSTGADIILASRYFNLAEETNTGYGLRLSKNEVLIKEKFFAYVTVPERAQLVLVDTGSDSTTGTVLANINVSQSPATIPISIRKAGNYAIILNNPASDTEIMQNVVVLAPVVSKPGEVDGVLAGQGGLNYMGDAFSDLLGSMTMGTKLLLSVFIVVAGVAAFGMPGLIAGIVIAALIALPIWLTVLGAMAVIAYAVFMRPSNTGGG